MEMEIEKLQQMATMKPGDKFAYSSKGMRRIAEFVSFKQVNILSKIDGELWNIRKTGFLEIVERAPQKPVNKMDMKYGELFYIKQGQNAIIFEFIRMEKYMIIGKNVLNGCEERIHQSMFSGTVKQYQKAQKEMMKAE